MKLAVPSMQSPSALRYLALELLTHEAAERQAEGEVVEIHAESGVEATERACEKLRVYLSNRVGQDGYRLLLARALTLAKAQFPHLSAVNVGADGALAGLRSAFPRNREDTESKEAQEEIAEGAMALVGTLLGLLVILIGEDLTLRMLRTMWPKLKWIPVTGELDSAAASLNTQAGSEEETR